MLKAIHRMQRDERGFTLVELLIVIAIIAILAAIAIPQFSSYRAKAGKAACQSDVKNCINNIFAQLADNPGATPVVTDCTVSSACGGTMGITGAGAGTFTSVQITGVGTYTGTCTYSTTTNSVLCS